MDVLNNLGVLLGSSWASGISLYLTIAGLGITQRFGLVKLPGNLDALSSLGVIILAILLYAIEFVVDKIPYVDSAWDSVHTFIRPFGGATLAYLAAANAGPAVQLPVAILSGAVAMDAHLTKAASRAAINTSPEPVTNSLASIFEDALVIGALWLIVKHPIIAGLLVILFIIFSIWFLKKMFRFLKNVFIFFGSSKKQTKKTS